MLLDLYQAYLEAEEWSARLPADQLRRPARGDLEQRICATIRRIVIGGKTREGDLHFQAFDVSIGKDVRLSYFRVWSEPRPLPDGVGGYTFSKSGSGFEPGTRPEKPPERGRRRIDRAA
jgi:hypothetical protein